MKKIKINGKTIFKGSRLRDDDFIEEIDAPYSAEFLKTGEGYELLSVNADYTPTADEVIEELTEAGLEEPVEVIIIGADSAEELIEEVGKSDVGTEDNVAAVEEALGGESEEAADDDEDEKEAVDDSQNPKKTTFPKRNPKKPGK
jgi:hypothetical protein